MIRITLILGLAAALVAAGVYAGTLHSDLGAATRQNSTLTEAMHAMAREQLSLNQQLIEKERRRQIAQRAWQAAQQRLDHASQSTTISTPERECMHSAIPEPILNELRQPRPDATQPSPQNLPTDPTDQPTAGAEVHGTELARPCGLCHSVRVAAIRDGLRSPANTGVL